jgi:hypothetical protein
VFGSVGGARAVERVGQVAAGQLGELHLTIGGRAGGVVVVKRLVVQRCHAVLLIHDVANVHYLDRSCQDHGCGAKKL